MTLKDENESYAGGFAAGLGDDIDDGTAGGSGGGVTTGGNAFSSRFGCSVKTPMYFKSFPTPKMTAISPYGNFIDVSSKDQKLLWRKMVKSDADFVPLDMTVAKSKAIIDLFTDKAITFRWMRFMRIPIIGDGITGTTPNRTPSGRETYNVNLSVFKNLIEDFNHLTLDDVMAFASWFKGDLTTPQSVRLPTNMTMKYLNLNASGNDGLVALQAGVSCGFLFGMAYHQESFLRDVLQGSSYSQEGFCLRM
jgi:hypothetical protein